LTVLQVHEARFQIQLTMEQGPIWGANRSLPSQEMPSILQNPKVHYRVYKIPLLGPALRQTNQVHVPPNLFLHNAF